MTAVNNDLKNDYNHNYNNSKHLPSHTIIKTFISISLLFLFISNSLFKAALIIDYWQNKKEIIADCCVNKNKPELECNGKCYIDTGLDMVDKNTRQELPGKIIEREHILFFSQSFPFIPEIFTCHPMVHEPIENQYTFDPSFNIFHPPVA